MHISVESVVFGSPEEHEGLPTVTLTLVSERISAAELIRRSVEQQIEDLLKKQGLQRETAIQQLNRQYLTREEIDSQAQTGSIQYRPHPGKNNSTINVAREVKRAQQAFRKQAFRIIIGSETVEALSDEITLTENTNVIFLRLMPLVGG